MMKVLKGLLLWCFTAVRGKTTVNTLLTGSTYRVVHHVRDDKTLERKGKITLECFQFKHTVRYDTWNGISWSQYSYQVNVFIHEDGGEPKSVPPLFFPQLCSNLMTYTKYPHHCAINAALDAVINMQYRELCGAKIESK
jgi:hypothetical protein